MHPRPVRAGQRHDRLHGVDGAETRGPEGGDHGADVALPKQVVQRVEVHPAGDVRGNGVALDAEHVAHPGVRVMGLGGVGDPMVGVQLASDEQGFEVARGARRGQVTEVGRRNPNIAASPATTSFSIAAVAGPPSRAWLLGLISMVAV